MFSIARFLAALAALMNAIPEAVAQYRRDPERFMQSQRLAGLYIVYAAAGIAIMLFLLLFRGQPSEARAGFIILFVMLWMFYGGLWLGRLLPKGEEAHLPRWLDRRPSLIDLAMAGATAGAFLWALLG